jgi:hypothetical protein
VRAVGEHGTTAVVAAIRVDVGESVSAPPSRARSAMARGVVDVTGLLGSITLGVFELETSS